MHRAASQSQSKSFLSVVALAATVSILCLSGCNDDVPVVGSGDSIATEAAPPPGTPAAPAPAASAPVSATPKDPAAPQSGGTVAAPQDAHAKDKEPLPPPEFDSFGTSHKPACGEGWYTNNVKQAEEKAQSLGLPLLLIFEDEECKHCRQFNNEYLADKEMEAIVRSPKLVIAKRFFDQWDKSKYDIRHTPCFVGIQYVDGKPKKVEHLPGLLPLDLLKKRLRDLSEGRGRLGRYLQQLADNPQDFEAVQVILDEYLELYSPREKIDFINAALKTRPNWSHGIAMKIWTLGELSKNGNPSAGQLLEQFVGESSARIIKGVASAADFFTVGYAQMYGNQMDTGVVNLEKSIELEKSDPEVYCHLAYGYTFQAARKMTDGNPAEARRLLLLAERMVRTALAFDPEYALATTRQNWINEQWAVLKLERE